VKRFLAWFIRLHTHVWAFPAVCLSFAAWLLAGQALGFDPYPYPLLTNVVSLWAILLSLATLAKVDETHDRVHREDDPLERTQGDT